MSGTNEMLATLGDVIGRLDDLKIPYMVTGSFAMSTYITARTTLDIDVVIEIGGVDSKKFEAKFRPDYYVSAASIDRARRDQSIFNMLSNITGIKVDCILRKPNRFEAEKFARRLRATLGGVEFWAISKNDLILSKLRWAKDSHSELQFRDIQNLLESNVTKDEIVEQVTKEGLQPVWQAFKEWTIQAKK